MRYTINDILEVLSESTSESLYNEYPELFFESTSNYDPPYNKNEILENYGQEMLNKLIKDPAHKWRMDTGIELIHREPTLAELKRIWSNWNKMTLAQKEKSDKKSIELFGKTNKENYELLITLYESAKKSNTIYIETTLKSTLDKDFKPKGEKKLSDFKKVKIDHSFIKKYKDKTKLLNSLHLDSDDAYAFMDNDDIVAIVAVDSTHKDTDHNWITAIEVTKDYQGYGLSKQLLDYAVKNMKGNALAVQNNNEIAKHTYLKYGFKPSKESQADNDAGRSNQLYMYLQ